MSKKVIGWTVSEEIGVFAINPRVYGPESFYKEKLQNFVNYQSPEQEVRDFVLSEMKSYSRWSADLYRIIETSFPQFSFVLKLFPLAD